MLLTLVAASAIAAAPPRSPSGGGTEITVYNQGMGLVKQVRTLNLKAGRQTVAVEDVAAEIDPTSVGVKSLDGDAFDVLEQNYQYDLISPDAILEKAVGQRIRFVRTIGNQRDVLEGVLLSAPTAVVNSGGGAQQTYNGMVIKTDDGRIVLDPTGEVEVQSVPAGLISRPTLLWDLQAKKAGPVPVELSYITQGMTWSADYVLTLDGRGAADLQGWVTMNNESGASFENAKLKLLAGDVQRVVNAPIVVDGMVEAPAAAAAPPAFQEEGLFEYHLYTLQRPATIRNKETKQLSLLEGHGVPVRKRLIVDALRDRPRYFPAEGEVGVGDVKPQVRIEFTNDKASGLGMPLPAGRFRVYQRDNSGSVQLLGEDRIDHTPRAEKVSLVVGRSFDVVASRRRTEFHRHGPRSVSESFEIEVRNRKDEAETVDVYERHWSDWKIRANNQPYQKLDANTVDFVTTLRPNEVRKIAYTVDTRW